VRWKREKIGQLYKSAHCFLYSTEFQSNPGEAMSMGIPVITNVPTDIMSETNSYIIPRLEINNFNCTLDVAEIKQKENFKKTMRMIFNNPSDAKKKVKLLELI